MMKRIYMLLWLAGCLALSLSAQQTKELYLLQTSDMHSRVEPLAADAADADAGKGGLARLFRMARFPVVCSNYDVTGTPLEGLVKPYVVIERDGLRIGLFGLAPQPEGLIQADKCQGVVYKDPIPVAQEMADLLRNEEHCDAVICLSHLGIRGIDPKAMSDEKLVVATSGIDTILGGHSHTFMETPAFYPNAEGRETPVFHTGKNGVYVGVWTLTLTKK